MRFLLDVQDPDRALIWKNAPIDLLNHWWWFYFAPKVAPKCSLSSFVEVFVIFPRVRFWLFEVECFFFQAGALAVCWALVGVYCVSFKKFFICQDLCTHDEEKGSD